MTTMTASDANARATDLSAIQLEVLRILAVHARLDRGATAARRTTLEAYANALAHETPDAPWMLQAVSGGLRRQIVEALLDLRVVGLVELTDAGYVLTPLGQEAIKAQTGGEAEGLLEALREVTASWRG